MQRVNGSAQRVMVDGVTSVWPKGSVLGLVRFDVLINDLYAGLEGILSKFVYYTKSGGAVDSVEGREDLQRDLDK